MSLNRLPSAVERAFEIARSGQVASIDHLKKPLDREGTTNTKFTERRYVASFAKSFGETSWRSLER